MGYEDHVRNGDLRGWFTLAIFSAIALTLSLVWKDFFDNLFVSVIPKGTIAYPIILTLLLFAFAYIIYRLLAPKKKPLKNCDIKSDNGLN
jgi:short subunit fatty acids transporter